MLPPPGARAAPGAPTRLHGAVLTGSAVLHAVLLMMLWRAAPPPAPLVPPTLELAFQVAPVPPPSQAAQPAPDLPEPSAPMTPEATPPEAPPPASTSREAPPPEATGPEATVPEPSMPAPPMPAPTAVPAAVPARHVTPVTKVKPKLVRPLSHLAISPPPALAPVQAPSASAEPAPVARSPEPDPAPAIASPAWQTAVGTWLRTHKTYPDAARRDAEQGRVVVRFTVQRDGTVTGVTLLQGSGSAVLDLAAQALLRGAHLPPFPPGMAQDQQSISLGISYALDP